MLWILFKKDKVIRYNFKTKNNYVYIYTYYTYYNFQIILLTMFTSWMHSSLKNMKRIDKNKTFLLLTNYRLLHFVSHTKVFNYLLKYWQIRRSIRKHCIIIFTKNVSKAKRLVHIISNQRFSLYINCYLFNIQLIYYIRSKKTFLKNIVKNYLMYT